MSARQILIVFIALAVLSAGIILMGRQNKKTPERGARTTPTRTVSPSPAKTQPPMLALRETSGVRVYRKGDSIPLTVLADSQERSIVGYDVVISFDPDTVSYVGAVNLQKEFDIAPALHDNKVVLTGVKNIELKEGTVFRSEPLADITFRALADGPANLALVYEPGKTNDSNLMTDTSEDVLSSVAADSVGVGQRVELNLNTPAEIENGAVTLTLTASEKPEPQCADCIESATVRVTKDGQSQDISFRSGGFAGFMQTDAEAFGYSFHAAAVKNGGLTLLYYLK